MKSTRQNPGLSTVLMIALYTSGLQGASNLTAISLGTADCSSWPHTHTVDDWAGSFYFQVDQTSDPAFDKLLLGQHIQPSNIRLAVDPLSRLSMFQKWSLSCQGGVVGLGPEPTGQFAARVRTADGPMRGVMFLGEESGSALEPYRIEADGEEMEGVFLGADGKVGWVFSYASPGGCGESDYFEARLEGMEFGDRSNYQGIDIHGLIKIVTDLDAE